MMTTTATTSNRLSVTVRGIVQGVGFRPFVYGLALRLGLGGFVLNDSGGVTIEIEGLPESLPAFLHASVNQAPPMARIDSLTSEQLPPTGDRAFAIRHSQAG